jgi:hypothetical protein
MDAKSRKHGNNLVVATCNDKIHAVMQMTNYRAYLKGNLSMTGPSRQELKLRVAKRSDDPKKTIDALT